MFGLTDKGFKRKRYNEIIAEKEDRARALFGEDVNLDESSPLGLFIRLNAWEEGLLWQLAEEVYLSAFVDTATGSSLDKVAQYIGIRRTPAQKAEALVLFTGDDETEVPSGFVVSTTDGVEFETVDSGVIDAGEVSLTVKAVEPGTLGNVPANTITEPLEALEGLSEATNPDPAEGGLDQETDQELRGRYIQSVAMAGASTVDSIRARLLNVPGVRASLVVANNSDSADEEGRPPKSFESYVLGGDPEDVAEAILETGPAGIQPYGEETETVLDASGQEQSIGFTYATEVEVFVDVDLTTNPEFPVDGEEKVRTEIVRYIGGEDADGQLYAGLTMGQDVIYNQIIKACFKVPGVEDATVYIGTAPDPTGTDNISIDTVEVAETGSDKVVIE